MKAIIKFDTYNKNVKRKSVVEIELKENKEGKPVFSVCGSMRGTAGQCLDTIRKYNSTPLFKEIFRLWKAYHLNDMNAGTVAQEEALKEAVKNGLLENYYASNYEKVCEYLKSIGLYEDNGYKYGTGWLYRAIPENDLEIIKKIITEHNPSTRYNPYMI